MCVGPAYLTSGEEKSSAARADQLKLLPEMPATRTNWGSVSRHGAEFAHVQSFCVHAAAKSGCAANWSARSKMVRPEEVTPRNPNEPDSAIWAELVCGWK